MGVTDGHGHGRALQKTSQRRTVGRNMTRQGIHTTHFVTNLCTYDAIQPGIHFPEEIVGGIAGLGIPIALQTCHTGIMGLHTGQHQGQPVHRFIKTIRLFKDSGCFLQGLQNLGEHPLRGAGTAAVDHPLFIPGMGHTVKMLGLLHGAVMLPQLHISVRFVFKFRQKANRHSLFVHRQYSAGGKVDAKRSHLFPVDGFQNTSHNGLQRIQIILGMLEGILRRQFLAAGQLLVHNAMGIGKDRLCHLNAGIQLQRHRPGGQGSEVNTDGILFAHKVSLTLQFFFIISRLLYFVHPKIAPATFSAAGIFFTFPGMGTRSVCSPSRVRHGSRCRRQDAPHAASFRRRPASRLVLLW